MSRTKSKNILFERRRSRVRSQVVGSPTRPRLCVYRSNQYLYVQVIDDTLGKTLASVHSRDIAGKERGIDKDLALGKRIAEKTLAQKITSVVFDRSGYLYHGRVKAVADGAREGGLQF